MGRVDPVHPAEADGFRHGRPNGGDGQPGGIGGQNAVHWDQSTDSAKEILLQRQVLRNTFQEKTGGREAGIFRGGDDALHQVVGIVRRQAASGHQSGLIGTDEGGGAVQTRLTAVP